MAWGTHLCLFYKSSTELRQLLTAFLQVGLADGECCVWITGPSLSEEEALASLQRSLPEVPDYFKRGSAKLHQRSSMDLLVCASQGMRLG